MTPLTNEEYESCVNQINFHIFKKNFQHSDSNDKS